MTFLPAPASVDQQQRRFGRLQASDPHDLNYPLETHLRSLSRAELKRQTQAFRRGPILDQGASSRCVQYALAAALGAAPFMHRKDPLAITAQSLDGHPDLYRFAQATDEFSGDESTGTFGTSARAGCEYLLGVGAISGYFWAQNVEVAKDFITRAGTGPLVAGSDWHASMDTPNAKGIIETLGGGVLGGHEWCVLWWDKKRGLWKAQNSWSADWGLKGIFYVPDDLFQYLIWNSAGDLASLAEVRA